MSLKANISEDMKAAMKAKTAAASAVRLLLAAIKQRGGREESFGRRGRGGDREMIKQRRDSIAQFQAANRKASRRRNLPLNLLSATCPSS
jgi:uncharacterized protein YqeY